MFEQTNSQDQIELSAYSGVDFFEVFCKEISSSGNGDRISVTTMSVEPREQVVQNILTELACSAIRGADVNFAVDDFTFLFPRSFMSVAHPLPFGTIDRIHRQSALQNLRIAGVNTNVINKPNYPISTLHKGRSHLKIYAINDNIFFGGPSLHGTDRSDIVIGLNHNRTADFMHQMIKDLTISQNTKEVLGQTDIELPIDQATKIIIDVGRPKQSAILDEAISLIDEAEEHIIIGSQYFPGGIVGKKLLAAHQKGKDITIAYSHPSKHDRLKPVHFANIAIKKAFFYPPSFFDNEVPPDQPKLHAKVLASEKSAIVASHNFVETGVNIGTPEIALVRHSPFFAKTVRQLLLDQIQPNQ